MVDQVSPPTSSHGEERRFIQPLDNAEAERVNRIREMRLKNENVSTYRAKGLGWFSVFSIIANRMIGTGIFRTPDTLMTDIASIPASMLFWLAGMIIALAGTMVFIEFGLAIPRLHGESVPRNGGEKNYLEYTYSKESSLKPHPRETPASLHQSQLLATCLYGIPFICLGNMAGNAIVFGENIMIACGSAEPTNGPVRAIAVGVATFACTLHIVSRWVGIALNNFFGSVKAAMLLMLIIVGVISFAGGLSVKTRETAKENYGVHGNFDSASRSSYGYAASFLSVIFAFGGFNQANYVLGTIYRPRRRFKLTALVTVSIVSTLYICLNLCYFGVVPYKWQVDETSRNSTIATDYFTRTLMGQQGDTVSKRGKQAVAAFMSFSSLGNIIVQTFTAARVKQELAKEGILPWSKFFARNRSWHWRFWRNSTRHDYESPEATPVGALLLHWVFSISLILGTYSLSPTAAYKAYVGMYSFTIDALFGFFVGLALLLLRLFESNSRWSTISHENRWISISCAVIFTLGNAYPLAAIWVPPSRSDTVSTSVSFWVTGTVGLVTVAFGALYWLGIRYVAPWWLQEELVVEREVITGNEGGETVVINEIVSIEWEDRSF